MFVTNKIKNYYNTHKNILLEYILHNWLDVLKVQDKSRLQLFIHFSALFSWSIHITNHCKKEKRKKEKNFGLLFVNIQKVSQRDVRYL